MGVELTETFCHEASGSMSHYSLYEEENNNTFKPPPVIKLEADFDFGLDHSDLCETHIKHERLGAPCPICGSETKYLLLRLDTRRRICMNLKCWYPFLKSTVPENAHTELGIEIPVPEVPAAGVGKPATAQDFGISEDGQFIHRGEPEMGQPSGSDAVADILKDLPRNVTTKKRRRCSVESVGGEEMVEKIVPDYGHYQNAYRYPIFSFKDHAKGLQQNDLALSPYSVVLLDALVHMPALQAGCNMNLSLSLLMELTNALRRTTLRRTISVYKSVFRDALASFNNLKPVEVLQEVLRDFVHDVVFTEKQSCFDCGHRDFVERRSTSAIIHTFNEPMKLHSTFGIMESDQKPCSNCQEDKMETEYKISTISPDTDIFTLRFNKGISNVQDIPKIYNFAWSVIFLRYRDGACKSCKEPECFRAMVQNLSTVTGVDRSPPKMFLFRACDDNPKPSKRKFQTYTTMRAVMGRSGEKGYIQGKYVFLVVYQRVPKLYPIMHPETVEEKKKTKKVLPSIDKLIRVASEGRVNTQLYQPSEPIAGENYNYPDNAMQTSATEPSRFIDENEF